MTAGPGEPGDPRTLQDPLAEALRVVDLADERGLLVRLMGGMAIRAHAPDWPARTRRVEVDLDFATRGKDRGAFYELLAERGLHGRQAPQRAVRRQAGLLRGRAAQPSGRRPGGQPGDVPPLRVRRPARRCRARRCRWPSCCCRSSRSSRSTARTCSTRSSCSPSTRSGQDDGRPTRATAWVRSTSRASCRSPSNDWGWWRTVTGNLDTLDQYLAVELDARRPRPQQRPGRPVRPGRPGRRACARPSTTRPKSTRWKLRARVGERQAWYQDPEEMGHN